MAIIALWRGQRYACFGVSGDFLCSCAACLWGDLNPEPLVLAPYKIAFVRDASVRPGRSESHRRGSGLHCKCVACWRPGVAGGSSPDPAEPFGLHPSRRRLRAISSSEHRARHRLVLAGPVIGPAADLVIIIQDRPYAGFSPGRRRPQGRFAGPFPDIARWG